MRALLPLSLLVLLTACGDDTVPAPKPEPVTTPEATTEAPQPAPVDLPKVEVTPKLSPAPNKPAEMAPEPEPEELMAYPETMVHCPEARPDACTMDYRPVTGWLEDGSTQEYSNSCVACADTAVVGYVDNANPSE